MCFFIAGYLLSDISSAMIIAIDMHEIRLQTGFKKVCGGHAAPTPGNERFACHHQSLCWHTSECNAIKLKIYIANQGWYVTWNIVFTCAVEREQQNCRLMLSRFWKHFACDNHMMDKSHKPVLIFMCVAIWGFLTAFLQIKEMTFQYGALGFRHTFEQKTSDWK